VSGYRHWQGFSFGGNKPEGPRLSSTFRRRYLSERNKLKVMVLMTDGKRLMWLLPLHFVLCFIETLIVCLMKFNWDYGRKVQVPAWQVVWKDRKWIVDKRRTIQKNKKVSTKEFLDTFTSFPHKLVLLCTYGIPQVK
jgi:hypothetical protein